MLPCTPSPISTTGTNNDETRFPDRRGNFHKGLRHDANGLVDVSSYSNLLSILSSGNSPAYEGMPLDLGRPLVNPQAGKATDLEGPSPSTLQIRAAPQVDSLEATAEATELYWMALLRDVPFELFDRDPGVAAAAAELSATAQFTGPKIGGSVTPQSLFRGCEAGNLDGPLLSQFLLLDIPYGSLSISQRQETVATGVDYLTDPTEWLSIQNGAQVNSRGLVDGTRRYMRNMRDLAHYVHIDQLYEGYLNAALILLGMGAPVDSGNPYAQATRQIGFGTFGGPHLLSLVTEVATRALKAVWYQKWYVHRRLRPEAYGGLVEKNILDGGNPIFTKEAVARTAAKFGSRLLPMAFPEGSPMHPAYGAGHATVAGACVTILKAWFKEDTPLPNPVVATNDGTALIPYQGAATLTVGGELNKLSANISIGRNMAGVHWRSDYFESVRLGETVAIFILEKQCNDYFEDFSFTLRSFDGQVVVIRKGQPTTYDGVPRPTIAKGAVI